MAEGKGRASLLSGPRGKFVIGEFPVPDPAPGAVLMKVELCGVCGTDVHTWQSEDIGLEYPISLGHEIVGTVEALGEDVKTDYIGRPLKVGDRIGVIPAIHCHRCYFCTISKTPEKCIHWKTYGTWPRADREPHFTGGYADYLYIHDPNSVFLKMECPAERGVFLEPVAVVIHAILLAQIKLGDTVVVQGCGPIGLLTIACASVAGASRIIAIGRRNRKRLELARTMGAKEVISVIDMPDLEERRRFIFEHSINRVGADVVFNTVGSPQAFEEGFHYVRDAGTFVEVGNFVDTGAVAVNPATQVLGKDVKVIGSFDNEAEHFVRGLPVIEDERLPLPELITHRLPLEDVERACEAIRKGEPLDGKEIVKIVIDPSLP